MTSRTPLEPGAEADRLRLLERSNRNLSLLLRSAPVPVLLLGPDLRIAHRSGPLADVARTDLTDRGAPLRSLEWDFDMGWLPAAAERVRDGGPFEERTVEAPALDARYVVRVLPWAAENGSGVAVAFQPLDSAGGIIDQRRCREALAGVRSLGQQLSNAMLLTRAIIRRSAETADSLQDYVLHLETRLDSMHRVVAELVEAPQRAFDLCEMINDELEAQGAGHAGGDWTLKGPKVAVRAPAAPALGLVFQELVTNAIQHGSLGGDQGGQLHVAWVIVEAPEGRRLQLDWRERGEVRPPRRDGFGTTVLESILPWQLDGRATRRFDQDGLRVSLAIPMASLAADPDGAFELF